MNSEKMNRARSCQEGEVGYTERYIKRRYSGLYQVYVKVHSLSQAELQCLFQEIYIYLEDTMVW